MSLLLHRLWTELLMVCVDQVLVAISGIQLLAILIAVATAVQEEMLIKFMQSRPK
jgi:hypothetical protein